MSHNQYQRHREISEPPSNAVKSTQMRQLELPDLLANHDQSRMANQRHALKQLYRSVDLKDAVRVHQNDTSRNVHQPHQPFMQQPYQASRVNQSLDLTWQTKALQSSTINSPIGPLSSVNLAQPQSIAIQKLDMPKPKGVNGLNSIHLRNSEAYQRVPSNLLNKHLISADVRSQAELRELIAAEETRKMQAMALAFQQPPFQPLTVRQISHQQRQAQMRGQETQISAREWTIVQPQLMSLNQQQSSHRGAMMNLGDMASDHHFSPRIPTSSHQEAGYPLTNVATKLKLLQQRASPAAATGQSNALNMDRQYHYQAVSSFQLQKSRELEQATLKVRRLSPKGKASGANTKTVSPNATAGSDEMQKITMPLVVKLGGKPLGESPTSRDRSNKYDQSGGEGGGMPRDKVVTSLNTHQLQRSGAQLQCSDSEAASPNSIRKLLGSRKNSSEEHKKEELDGHRIDESTMKDLLESSIVQELNETEVTIKEEIDPKRLTMIVSPWQIQKTTKNAKQNEEGSSGVAQGQQNPMTTTQSSFNNIPFRNAQIISKIMSDTNLSGSGEQQSQMNEKEEHPFTSTSKDTGGFPLDMIAQDQQQVPLSSHQGVEQDKIENKAVSQEAKAQQDRTQTKKFQLGNSDELLELRTLDDQFIQDESISDLLGSPRLRKRKKKLNKSIDRSFPKQQHKHQLTDTSKYILALSPSQINAKNHHSKPQRQIPLLPELTISNAMINFVDQQHQSSRNPTAVGHQVLPSSSQHRSQKGHEGVLKMASQRKAQMAGHSAIGLKKSLNNASNVISGGIEVHGSNQNKLRNRYMLNQLLGDNTPKAAQASKSVRPSFKNLPSHLDTRSLKPVVDHPSQQRDPLSLSPTSLAARNLKKALLMDLTSSTSSNELKREISKATVQNQLRKNEVERLPSDWQPIPRGDIALRKAIATKESGMSTMQALKQQARQVNTMLEYSPSKVEQKGLKLLETQKYVPIGSTLYLKQSSGRGSPSLHSKSPHSSQMNIEVNEDDQQRASQLRHRSDLTISSAIQKRQLTNTKSPELVSQQIKEELAARKMIAAQQAQIKKLNEKNLVVKPLQPAPETSGTDFTDGYMLDKRKDPFAGLTLSQQEYQMLTTDLESSI